MDPKPAARIVRFGVFELDVQSGELRRHGLKIRLPDQSFQILKLLLSRPGDVVTREEFRHALWTSNTFVDFEVGLNSAIRKLREALETNHALARKFAELEKRVGKHDAEIGAIIDAIRQLMTPPEKPRREIGFHVREKAPRYGTRKLRISLNR